jgi:FkbM family methyltransferase
MAGTAPGEDKSVLKYSAIDYLAQIKGHEVSLEERSLITASCKDTDLIPKVQNAGRVLEQNDQKYQLMHNGIKVVADGYYGDWMTNLITNLHGHHEPQEEKVFYELSKLFNPDTVMIELGSYWSYYSLWFHKVVSGAFNICCEPDPDNKTIGQANFKLNAFDNVVFVDGVAGEDDGKIVAFETGRNIEPIDVPIRSVDSLVAEYGVKRLELLHIDVQGSEFDALLGATNTIKSGKLRFVFVSTHHYLMSRDPDIHQRCMSLIEDLGGHIICEHDIHESFSGDGLIVASFAKADRELSVEVSHNRMVDSQFRAYMKDLELVFGAYEIQLDRLAELKQELANKNVDKSPKKVSLKRVARALGKRKR